ncbi:MAG: elongation factor Ts [Oceanicoccus sp.]|jgi:elongation factor Ts
MAITLDQIKSLRDRTGISATACKKALEEAEGDESKAIELLRKKGAAKAASRSDRETEHGVVSVSKGAGKIAIVAIGCETDFVSKNEDFQAKIDELAVKVLAEGQDADLSKEIDDLNIQMGERIVIVGQRILEGATIGSYIHLNKKIGVAIAIDGSSEEVANDISMHIAAMNPTTLSPSDIDDAVVAKEKEIWAEQLAGKPAEIMGKIMEGKERKFREESALLSQPFVKNPDKRIEELLGGANVVEFIRYAV